MKQFCLQAEIKRAFVRTTDSRHDYRVYPNLLAGRTLTGVNQAWGADFTYIRIVNGFVYLAVILDLFSRKVDVIENLPIFLEEVYNEKRVHSALEYLTPSELENAIAVDPSIASRFELHL
jgi:transposase InsO family protein